MGRFLGRMAPVTIVVALLISTGCSTIDLNAARKLASAGVSASTAAAEETKEARENFIMSRDYVVVLKGASNRFVTDPRDILEDDAFKANEEMAANISRLLVQRQRVLRQLATTYRAFEELAHYDAIEEFRTAYDDLAKETNGFIEVLNTVTAATPIPLLTSTVIGTGRTVLSIAADERHKGNVERGSILLREAMEKLIAALRAEQQYAASLRRTFIEQQGALRSALMSEGLLSYQGEVNTLAQQLGAEAVKNVDAVIAQQPKLRTALDTRIRYRTQRSGERVVTEYDAILGALIALRGQHLTLEKGRPINFTVLREWISLLEDLTSDE